MNKLVDGGGWHHRTADQVEEVGIAHEEGAEDGEELHSCGVGGVVCVDECVPWSRWMPMGFCRKAVAQVVVVFRRN